jgi:predicted nucleic acid-binding protein
VSRFVIDASVVLTWCFPDEEAQRAEAVAERIASGETVVVPAFWRHEVLNALLVGERRKRLTAGLIDAFLQDLNRLPIDSDDGVTAERVFEETLTLCRRHRLTSYDAAYLELAMREGCALATVDDALRNAAVAEQVALA